MTEWYPISTALRSEIGEILGAVEISKTKAGHPIGGSIEIIRAYDSPVYGAMWIKRNGDQYYPTYWAKIEPPQ